MKYILQKMIGDRLETVEVLEGREDRLQRLLAAGYEIVNADSVLPQADILNPVMIEENDPPPSNLKKLLADLDKDD